jgi:hypothetical protein
LVGNWIVAKEVLLGEHQVYHHRTLPFLSLLSQFLSFSLVLKSQSYFGMFSGPLLHLKLV